MHNKIHLFARKCNVTGALFNAGFVIGDTQYAKTHESALKVVNQLGFKSLSEAYKDGMSYYTEFEDLDSMEYAQVGDDFFVLEEINDCHPIKIQIEQLRFIID